MTDTPKVDQEATEGVQGNQPEASSGESRSIEGQSKESKELLELRKDLANVRSELRGLQGRQDKAQSEVQRFMSEVKAKMKDGLSLDEAERAVEAERKAAQRDAILDKLAENAGLLASESKSPGKGGESAADMAKVFASVGLDPSDPDVQIALAESSGKTPAEIKLAAYELKERKSNQPIPSGAQTSASEKGKLAPRKLTAEEADAKYLQLEALYREPTKYASQIKALETEMKEAGLLDGE